MGTDVDMFVTTNAVLTEQDISDYNREIRLASGNQHLSIVGPIAYHVHHYYPEYCQRIEQGVAQGCRPMIPSPEEGTWLRVYLRMRDNYDNRPLVLSIAAWLQWRVPESTVWYGPDSDCSVYQFTVDDLLWDAHARSREHSGDE